MLAPTAWAQPSPGTCGPLASAAQYGPYDYRTQQDKLPIVEVAHFTPIVENLVRGQNSGIEPGGDLDYTLRAFPNHHRALVAMMRYGEKKKSDRPPGTNYSVECYFERATRFKPDDPIVRMLYASYLGGKNRAPEAVRQLEFASTAPDPSGFTSYNIGLVYFDLKEYDKALAQAHKAIALGFPQTTLQELLAKAGKWSEPAAGPPAPPAPPASAAEGATAPTAPGSSSASSTETSQ